MRKLFLIAKRDYLAAVRTKAFVIGLLSGPILLGGSFFGSVLLKQQPTKQVRHIGVLDRTGVAAQTVVQQLKQQNQRDAVDKNTGAQIMPKYEFEIEPSSPKDADTQLLMLSNRVPKKQLFGFIEIQPTSVRWYSNEGGFGETGRWLAGPLNDGLCRIRLRDLGISGEQADQLLKAVLLESMSLVARDEKTGRIAPARKRGAAEGFATPFVLAMLFFMVVLATAAPMLTAVAEDKTQRVFEMLLVSATPFELIGGKVLAAVGTALTSSIVYVIGALLLLQGLAMIGFAPLQVVPWFFLYLIAEVIMLASVATALGAACNSIQAENLKMIPIFPVVMPMLFLTAVFQDPNGGLATAMSFVPLFTPIWMLVRQASPSGIPAWQPVVGLIDVLATTMAFSWMASRIFRIALLFQGKTPTAVELIRWGLSG